MGLTGVDTARPDALVAPSSRDRGAQQPNYAEARNNLGLVLASRGRIDEAIAQFQKALEANPTSGEIRNNLGAALASRKRNPGADRSESR